MDGDVKVEIEAPEKGVQQVAIEPMRKRLCACQLQKRAEGEEIPPCSCPKERALQERCV